jgi:hypothetical protein
MLDILKKRLEKIGTTSTGTWTSVKLSENDNMLDNLKNRLEKIKSVSTGTWAGIKLSENDRNSRLDICNSCEFLFKPTNTCMKCGCFMQAKTYIPGAKCPLDKWPL